MATRSGCRSTPRAPRSSATSRPAWWRCSRRRTSSPSCSTTWSSPTPQTNAAITDGRRSITGNFTAESARLLADQLKFGALPISFSLQTQDDISPQLGSEQLRRGLLAGAIGLLLVVIYSLFQYRALGLVTVASLVVASVITYVAVTLLGWSHGFRLTMAGVTGLIVAIGITADSFIVYFERIRDEVRDGRPLRAAVETGWKRARRTILIADAVNFLAAVVLYVLAASNVRGFAFTLDADDAHRHPRRHPVHPPARGDAGPHQVLR